MKLLKNFDNFLAKTIIWFIKIYQKTISPDHSSYGKSIPFYGCKFHPSCSEYGILTLNKKGFFRGILPTIGRIFRCHPWSCGGVDFPK